MFRKQKNVSPYFRLPVPYNPVTGNDTYLHPPMKPYCRFILSDDLATDDEFQYATIGSDIQQWGPGMYHLKTLTIVVHNLLSKVEDVYEFSGSKDDVGIAVWDFDQHWRIIWLGRGGGLIGGCLAENHPGRGEEFDIYLGSWDSSAQKWIYDEETAYKSIDWRYGVPYPEAGSTGLFEARASDANGVIYEVVALDCETPGSCGE